MCLSSSTAQDCCFQACYCCSVSPLNVPEIQDVACADAFTPHSSRLSSELRPLASVPLLQHAPAPAVTVAAHVDRMTSASMRWLQVQHSPAILVPFPTYNVYAHGSSSLLLCPQLQHAQLDSPWPWPACARCSCFCFVCYGKSASYVQGASVSLLVIAGRAIACCSLAVKGLDSDCVALANCLARDRRP